MADKQTRLSKKQREVIDHHRIATDQWTRYIRARDYGHIDYLEKADKCNDYYIGDQWAEADIQKLKAEGRPYLTVNMILATVNAVIGEQAAKRVEFKYKPSTGGDETVATVLTKIVQAVKDSNQYDYVESQVFQDALISHGRGFFDVRMKFDENIHGDIVIRSDEPRNILLDPDAKEYDPSTWTEVFETRWMSPDEIEATYGQKKADEVRQIGINRNRFDTDSVLYFDTAYGDAREQEVVSHLKTGDEDMDAVRSVRVIERQHVKLVPCYKFVDPVTGEMKRVPQNWSERKIDQFAKKYNLFITRQVDKKIRWTVTADKVVLHDDWSPYSTFTKIPYFCYFRRGKPFGLVSNLISPQEQLNKLSSQELHIINTTANSGWKVEQGALVGMTADDLRNQGAETGLVIEVGKGRMDGIEKITPNSVPTGIDRLSNKSALFIKEISGVNEALLGQENPEISGVALQQNVARGLVGLQVPFDNLDLSRIMVGQKILELIQQFYTEERVFRITSDGLNFDDPQEEEIIINHQEGSGTVVNDVTTGKYKVNLSMFPARDSFNDAQFAEALNLRGVGVMIPDDRLVEYSHLARKEQLADEIRDMQGRGELTPEQQQMVMLQMQVEQQLMITEVQRAAAEVVKLEAEAAKLAAEAERYMGGLDSPEYQVRRDEIHSRIIIARENLQLRRDLAQLSNTSRLDTAALTLQGKLMTDTNKAKEDRQTQVTTGLLDAQSRQTEARIKAGAQRAAAQQRKEPTPNG